MFKRSFFPKVYGLHLRIAPNDVIVVILWLCFSTGEGSHPSFHSLCFWSI